MTDHEGIEEEASPCVYRLKTPEERLGHPPDMAKQLQPPASGAAVDLDVLRHVQTPGLSSPRGSL